MIRKFMNFENLAYLSYFIKFSRKIFGANILFSSIMPKNGGYNEK